jgi:hypothetical protein
MGTQMFCSVPPDPASSTVRYDDADIRPMAVALGVGSEPLVGVMNSSASCGFEWFTFVH